MKLKFIDEVKKLQNKAETRQQTNEQGAYLLIKKQFMHG